MIVTLRERIAESESNMTPRKNANATTKPARASKPRQSSHVPFSSVKVAYATARGTDDVTAASKTLRDRIRSNFDHLVKEYGWPVNKDNRDGNRYPDVPRKLADEIMAGRVPSGKANK